MFNDVTGKGMKSLGRFAVGFVDLAGLGSCTWLFDGGLWDGICVEYFLNFDEVSSEAA